MTKSFTRSTKSISPKSMKFLRNNRLMTQWLVSKLVRIFIVIQKTKSMVQLKRKRNSKPLLLMSKLKKKGAEGASTIFLPNAVLCFRASKTKLGAAKLERRR